MNQLSPRQIGRKFADNIFKRIFTTTNYQSFPLLSYLPWLFFWAACIHHDCCAVYDVSKKSHTLRPEGRILLFPHGISSLFLLRSLIWRHWKYEIVVRERDILSNVCLRLSLFSHLSLIQYLDLCILAKSFFLWWLWDLCCLSYHHNHCQIASMNYYPWFRIRKWNNGLHKNIERHTAHIIVLLLNPKQW